MKRRMRLLIAAALLGLCGCHNGNFHVEEAGDGIPLSECNLVGGMEKCLASGDATVTLDGGYAPELPAPLDLVMPELRLRLGDRRLTVIRPPQGGIVTEWNLYALSSVFSGKPLPSRDGFLKDRFAANRRRPPAQVAGARPARYSGGKDDPQTGHPLFSQLEAPRTRDFQRRREILVFRASRRG